jgi:hypothetical protein
MMFLVLKLFLFEVCISERSCNKMEHLKATRKALTEMNESYIDLLRETKETSRSVQTAKQLWRTGYKSKLIKIGVALVVFPEPTPISETVGACFIAAGAVQKAVRNRAMFMEDVKKTFQRTLNEISATTQHL